MEVAGTLQLGLMEGRGHGLNQCERADSFQE